MTPQCIPQSWHLCKQLLEDERKRFSDVKALWMSNDEKKITLYGHQLDVSESIVWDYHVVVVAWSVAAKEWTVFDHDAAHLPFGCQFSVYCSQVFAPGRPLGIGSPRWFRLVEASDYLRVFASDRSHMRSCASAAHAHSPSCWLATPPPWPCLSTAECGDNIREFWTINRTPAAAAVPGRIFDEAGLVRELSQPPPATSTASASSSATSAPSAPTAASSSSSQ